MIEFEGEETVQNNKEHVEINRIMATKVAEFFKLNKFNRRISKAHMEKLKKSIKEDGQLDPLKITLDGTIIDGHHRFLAIRSLKETDNADLFIKYVIIEAEDEIELIIKLNSTSKEWGTGDYIDIYASSKNEEYKKIIEIAAKYNQTTTSVLSTLCCGADVARFREVIKNGKDLNFDDWDLLEEYYTWIGELKSFVQVKEKVKQMLFRLYLHDKFNSELFYKQAKKEFITRNEKLRFSSTQNICKRQLLDIYNKGQNKKGDTYISYVLDADNKILLE